MQAIFFLSFILLSLPFLFILLGKTLLKARTSLRLRREGINGEAVIIDQHVGGALTYFIRYRYHHQGQTYEQQEEVSSKQYKTWRPGTQLPIRYLPQRPYVAEITANEMPLSGVFVIVVCFVVFIACLIAVGVNLPHR